MSDLVAGRTDQALALMGPEYSKFIGGPSGFKSVIEKLFSYCGRPLDSQFQHEERGINVSVDGRRREIRTFFYDASTDRFAKGACFFSVEVARNDASSGYVVLSFGPLKRAGNARPKAAP